MLFPLLISIVVKILALYELGDIFISIDKTKEQAKSYEQFFFEFCFLACHGMLHFLGYDHQNPEDEKEMIAKQNL